MHCFLFQSGLEQYRPHKITLHHSLSLSDSCCIDSLRIAISLSRNWIIPFWRKLHRKKENKSLKKVLPFFLTLPSVFGSSLPTWQRCRLDFAKYKEVHPSLSASCPLTSALPPPEKSFCTWHIKKRYQSEFGWDIGIRIVRMTHFMKVSLSWNRPQQSIETIASFDQWSGTFENHWKLW